MKLRRMLFTCVALFATVAATRANKDDGRPLYLPHTVVMNGALVPHGMYMLTLEGNNAVVHVTLWRNGRFIATAPGTWTKGAGKCVENTVHIRLYPDGTRWLKEIRLAGSSKSILLENTSAAIHVRGDERTAGSPDAGSDAQGENSTYHGASARNSPYDPLRHWSVDAPRGER